MSVPPIRTRRSRPPGFAAARTEENSNGVVAREIATAPTRDAESDISPSRATQSQQHASPRPAREAATNRKAPAPLDAANPPSGHDGGYAGAATRQFNTRLLEPLHRRYMRLVRDLADEGYETSMTELVHALLHDGPTTTTEARARIRAWRQLRAAE